MPGLTTFSKLVSLRFMKRHIFLPLFAKGVRFKLDFWLRNIKIKKNIKKKKILFKCRNSDTTLIKSSERLIIQWPISAIFFQTNWIGVWCALLTLLQWANNFGYHVPCSIPLSCTSLWQIVCTKLFFSAYYK